MVVIKTSDPDVVVAEDVADTPILAIGGVEITRYGEDIKHLP